MKQIFQKTQSDTKYIPPKINIITGDAIKKTPQK